MKKQFNIFVFIVALLGILISACANGSPAITGEWKLVSYGDASNPTLAVPDVETSIKFGEDGQFGGSVGCNSFGASYTISADKIAFESMISTLMFCDGVMEQESAISNMLSEQTVSFEVSGNQLKLTSADGTSVVILERK